MKLRAHARGLSLAEVLGSLAIGAFLFAALTGVALQSTRALDTGTAAGELQQQAQFALDRMIGAVRASPRLLIPAPDRLDTAHSEAQRSVLAVALDPTLDRDADGVADADNDGDGRVDEDPEEDMSNDAASGIIGIDDDGDGQIDEDSDHDDDEDGDQNEDNVDGIDNDGDGYVDEDVKHDMRDDGKPGVAGIDDDGDLQVDEGHNEDDDEDGDENEDWLDARVYRLNGAVLLERLPDVNAASGAIFTERPLATGVSDFRVTYVAPAAAGLPPLLDLSLTLTGAGGASASVSTRIRLSTGP